MTAERLAQRAGSAVLWQAGQLFAVNAVNIVNLIVLLNVKKDINSIQLVV